MASLSFALILSLVVQFCVVSSADVAISLPSLEPAAAGPTAAPGDVCGGCYVIADVAGIVFGTETLTQTHTLLTSIGVGLNGTNTTTTSFIEGTGQFTFNTGGVVGVAALTSFDPRPTITFSGITLTSPTVYNVFTAYSVTSTTISDGICVAVPGPKVEVSPAFQVPMPANVDAGQFARAAESSFIENLGLLTCSPGGENAATTSHFQITNTTITSTTTGPIRVTPQPIMTVAPSTTTTTTSLAPITIPTGSTLANVSNLSSPTVSLRATPTSLLLSSSSSHTSFLSSSSTSSAKAPLFPMASSMPVASSSGPTPTISNSPSPQLTSAISVGTIIIVGNSTFVPTGLGPNATIVPYLGAAADWKTGGGSVLLLWGTGILSTAVAIWAL